MRKIIVIGIIGVLLIAGLATVSAVEMKTCQQIQQEKQTLGNGENVANFGGMIDSFISYKKFLFINVPCPDSCVTEEKHIEISDWNPESVNWHVNMTLFAFKSAKLLVLPINLILYTVEIEIEGVTHENKCFVSTTEIEEISFPVIIENLNHNDTVIVKISVNGVFIASKLKIPLNFLKDPNTDNNELICSFTIL